MKKTILLLLLLTVSVLNFGQDNKTVKDGVYSTYYLKNGERISININDRKVESINNGTSKSIVYILKLPNGEKRIMENEIIYILSKTYYGHKLIYRNIDIDKQVKGIDNSSWSVIVKSKQYFLAYVPKNTTSNSDGTGTSSFARIYCIFDLDKNVVATIKNNKEAEKYFTEYFPELTNWHSYLQSINYNITLANWCIVDLATEVLAPKYYKSNPVIDNQYYCHELGTKIKIKKALKEVQTFAPQDSNTTTE